MKGYNFGTIKPSFIIIGVQKAGTSSLHHYLTQHPKLIAPELKELHYFDTLKPTPPEGYLDFFPKEYFTRNLSFEATPRYLYFPGTAKKLYEFDPNLKLIVILRDPVKRAYSAWNMYRQMSMEPNQKELARQHEKRNPTEKAYTFLYSGKFPSFEEWIKTEMKICLASDFIEPSIIRRGYYKEQIENYLNYFSRDQMHFVDFQDLKGNIISVLNNIAKFLNISEFNNLDLNLNIQNERKYTKELDPDLYKTLLSHFQEKNNGLEELVNQNLKWMHV
ncbi:sulfotransferase domain-containing protein [Ulvibacter antarcticus]|uniref:Sulfotransferase domain-containing protein n=1 Tax=Ulvibacter antarcticus TaxID=442714 RepID=A0A3L9YB61_9FLAO|nr:sulfotransferase domain-containing protein [Ulvibacter antarcticus]RMA57963.1 sulfotransferase domain-containing protein [Ulvibacter antarcticus]